MGREREQGEAHAFQDVPRCEPGYRPVGERVRDWRAVECRLPEDELRRQAGRCLDCGTPFCHASGCPLGNVPPEFNRYAARGLWKEALAVLLETSPFPEITARICPALCEGACVSGLDGQPVTVRQIELEVIERGFAAGLAGPFPPAARNGLRVAVAGSGPAGLAAADALNRAGCAVTVYEQADKPGGILRYGIPDFKLEKGVLDRRLEMLAREGVSFECGVEAGRDVSLRYLTDRYAAIVLACGARAPRDLAVPGRDLAGIHFAMDYLSAQNRRNAGLPVGAGAPDAHGKRVVVIGGGDTGSDCVGTAVRQGAREVVQVEILPKPPPARAADNPWPQWPRIARESSSHQEGCARRWCVKTKAFLGENGAVRGLAAAEVEWRCGSAGGRAEPVERPGRDFTVPADLVLLALGFEGPVRHGLLDALAAAAEPGGPPVMAAGDLALGPGLVVRAIADGRRAAAEVLARLAGRPGQPAM